MYTINTYNIFLLTGLRPSVTCYNFVGDGVPTMSSGHRSVRLCHDRIFINTRLIFIFHFQSLCIYTLILEPYYIISPSEHGCQIYRLPLLRHHKVKDWPRGDVLCHTGMAVGDILPNWLQPHFRYFLPNQGVITATVLTPRHPSSDPLRHPIVETTQQL